MSSLLILTTIIFLRSSITALASIEEYQNCTQHYFQCGNISGIGYPFWGVDRPEYCGYPGFELSCNNQTQTTEMKINNLTYQVLKIESEPRILSLARTDYTQDLCPMYFQNTTIDDSVFTYTNSKNITLYYNCRIIQPNYLTSSSGLSSMFTCTMNGNSIFGYYLTTNLTETALGIYFSNITWSLGLCTDTVIVPAYESAVQSMENSPIPNEANLVSAFGQGFGLVWNANYTYCDACNLTGGQCGYNPTTASFVCFCGDQTYSSGCGTNQPEAGKRSPSKVPLAVGLALGGVGIVGILLGWWFFATMRRRKMEPVMALTKDPSTPSLSSKEQTVTTTTYSQTIPSYPTSKSDIDRGSTYFGVQVFNHEDLEEATDNFDRSKELGDGGFGAVYYGVLGDGRAVAVKRLYENNMKRAEQFMNEIEILARLRHKNLVVLYGCTSRHGRELLLVYEYIPNGTVADHLHGSRSESGKLTWPVRFSIAIETAGALAYLHCSDVIHRDVKTNNILLDNNFSVKVADFGLSRLFPNDVTHVSTAPQGTPGYVDPEYYQCYHLTDKSDVYSFGVVLIELISSLQAVDTSRGRNDINLANMAVNKIQNQTLSEIVDPYLGFDKDHITRMMVTSVAALAFRCLQPERDMRPTMEEVLGTLRRIKNENYGSMRAEVVDFSGEDVRLLKHVPATFSPDSVANEKWVDMPHTY